MQNKNNNKAQLSIFDYISEIEQNSQNIQLFSKIHSIILLKSQGSYSATKQGQKQGDCLCHQGLWLCVRLCLDVTFSKEISNLLRNR